MAQNPPVSFGPDGLTVGAFSYPRPDYRPRWWLHLLLAVVTLATTTICGALFFGWIPEDLLRAERLSDLFLDSRFILEGLKFSIPLMLILGSHELGHYLACRAHRLAATPPFFLPFPLGIGTLGAVIRIKQPIRNKRELLDIGAAGPIAGFLVLVPFLILGVVLADVAPAMPDGNYYEFGEPLAFRAVEMVFLPSALADDASLRLHPTGWAAWCGLLVTLLNLLPLAQLDGGHVAYAFLGRYHRWAVWPLLGTLVALGFIWPGWWLWSVIVVFLGVKHPPLWDEAVPLDSRRRHIAWITLAIFVLCFMLEPIKYVP